MFVLLSLFFWTSVLRFAASDYHFGIFKHFLSLFFYDSCFKEICKKKQFHFVEQLLYFCLFVFCSFSFGLYIVCPASITASDFPFDVFKLFLLLFEHAYFSWRRAFLLVLGTNESEVAIVDSSVTPSVDRTIKVTELVDELIIVFTTDDLTTNDGSGFDIKIMESLDFCK